MTMNLSFLRISLTFAIIISLSGCRFFSKLMDEKEDITDDVYLSKYA